MSSRRTTVSLLLAVAVMLVAAFFPAETLAPANTSVIIRIMTDPTVERVDEIGTAETQQLGIPIGAAYLTLSDGRRLLAIGVWTGQGWDIAQIPLAEARGGDP